MVHIALLSVYFIAMAASSLRATEVNMGDGEESITGLTLAKCVTAWQAIADVT